MDGQIWALKADSLTSPLIVTVTVTVEVCISVYCLHLVFDQEVTRRVSVILENKKKTKTTLEKYLSYMSTLK